MPTPEERISRIEEALRSMRDTLATHTAQDEVNFRAINVALDANFKELMLLVHGLELNLLKEKADREDVAANKKRIEDLSSRVWKLIVVLAGTGVLGAGALKFFLGAG